MTPPERDAAILEHLRRYHLTTPEILHRLFFPGVGLNAVRKVTSRLSRERRISPARLFEQRKYFVLTPREAEHLGEHRSIGRKFEYQGLVNAYGILSFCAANGVKKFTPREFAEKFPELVIPGVRSGNYYLEPEETPEGRKFRLAFIVTVVTPTETKAAEIKIALSTEPPTPVRFRIEPVSELAELLTHRGRLKDARLRKPTQAEDRTPAAEPPATGPTLEHGEARSPVSKEAEASS